MELKDRAKQVADERIQRTKDFAAQHPDHPFTLANSHMLELTADNSWYAAGVLSMTGVVWWALNLTVDLAPPHVIIFNATGGPDFSFAIFTSAVTGYFFVDPKTLNGKECQFTMQSVAGFAGEVSFDLYDKNWSQVGSFLGLVAGVSLSKLTGEGTVQYK